MWLPAPRRKRNRTPRLLRILKRFPANARKREADKPMEDSYQGRAPIFYARVAGWIYLIAMAMSLFTQMYVPGKIDAPHDAFVVKGVQVQGRFVAPTE